MLSEVYRHLSQLEATYKSTVLSSHLQRIKAKLFRIYHIIDQPSFLIAIETLKQRITAFATRLQKYQERLLCQWQNHTFCSNQKAFYHHLCQDDSGHAGVPDNQQVLMF